MKEAIPSLTVSQVIGDFTIVQRFMKENKYVSFIYLSFIIITIFSFAMDAQVVVFTQQVIGLSEFEFSLLISITGIGSVSGDFFCPFFSNRLSLRYMIVIGLFTWTMGYVIYAISCSFISVTVGFIILGFFALFVNVGIMTFYQNNVPVEMMGRVTSIYQLIQSAIQVIFILIIGFKADLVSLRPTIVTLALIMLLSSIIYSFSVLKPVKSVFYREDEKEIEGLNIEGK